MAFSPPKPKRLRMTTSSPPRLPDDLLVDGILERLPPAAAVRSRAVCRAWNAAITSDHFLRARAARRKPELLFFAPVAGNATSFYACSLRDGEPATAARELVTLGNLSAEHVVLSPTPCRGLTLIFDARASAYYVCNLTTGDHVALPTCEPAADVDLQLDLPFQIDTRFDRIVAPWHPFEHSSTGLGFDAATGVHKVVRLFKKQSGEHSCEVYTLGGPGVGGGGWRPCAGQVPPDAASHLGGLPAVSLDGSIYWLLDRRILSFSVSAEQFGWVDVPPRDRICRLANLDGSLCAVYGNRLVDDVYELFTWSGDGDASPSPSWSMRCSINLLSLQPQEVSDELDEETEIVPLCTAGDKILLATGRHKVFAYDPDRDSIQRVFRMQDFVDVPRENLEARLLLNVGIHDERIIGGALPGAGERRLLVKPGGDNTVGKREESVDEYHDDINRRSNRHFRDFLNKIVGLLPLPHMNAA